MFKSRQAYGKRCIQRKQALGSLHGNDAARGEAAAIADTLYRKVDRLIGLAAAQEIGMQRVDTAFGIDGQIRGGKGLRQNLAAEQGLIRVGLVVPVAEDVATDRIEHQLFNDCAGVTGCTNVHELLHLLTLCMRPKTG